MRTSDDKRTRPLIEFTAQVWAEKIHDMVLTHRGLKASDIEEAIGISLQI